MLAGFHLLLTAAEEITAATLCKLTFVSKWPVVAQASAPAVHSWVDSELPSHQAGRR